MTFKCLIIQPGAYGDIFVCAPIAYHYHFKGHEIYWPVRKQFMDLLSYFPYVKPILLSDGSLHDDWLRSDVMKILPTANQYDLILNLADRGPHITTQTPNENFEQTKYRISNVPIEYKKRLVWTRNLKKEQELYDMLCGGCTEYIVVHREDSQNNKVPLPFETKLSIIDITQIGSYNIPDWFLILKRAKEIYCIESSVHQFIDGASSFIAAPKYLLRRPQVEQGCRFTISNGWNLKYIGENSKIKG